MKKSLLALAVMGAFTAPAMADVTISGAINVGPTWGRTSDGTAATVSNSVRQGDGNKGFSATSMTSNYSNINITSTDDIGGGNKLVFNYSLDVSNTGSTVHDTAGSARSRNTNMQFQGGWGSLGMGINEHIYERYQYSTDILDGAVGIGGNLQMLGTPGGNVFQNSASGCTAAAGCQEFYIRQGNSIFFDSANYSGLTFGIAFSLNAYKSSANDTNNPRFFSGGVKYAPEGGPFFVDFAVERHSNYYGLQPISAAAPTDGTSSKDTAMQLGAGVMFGDISVNLRYERLKYQIDSTASGIGTGEMTEYKRNAIWAGVKLGLSTGYAGIQLGIADDGDCTIQGASCDASKTGAFMLSGGYFHNLSNQTQLQFLFSHTKNDELGNYINIGSPATNVGARATSLGFGVKHVF